MVQPQKHLSTITVFSSWKQIYRSASLKNYKLYLELVIYHFNNLRLGSVILEIKLVGPGNQSDSHFYCFFLENTFQRVTWLPIRLKFSGTVPLIQRTFVPKAGQTGELPCPIQNEQ